jgi:hypothetical protein
VRRVKGILASYRWRRRFAWLGGLLVVVVALTVIVLEMPNETPKVQGPSNVPARIEKAPKPVRLTAREEAVALRVASEFVSTAVARKNVDRAWNLVSSDFRSGMTREDWHRGRLPVSPYSVRKTTWKFDFADSEGVGWTVTLYPTKSSRETPLDFQIGLHPVGSGKHRRWLVDYWQASPTNAAALSAKGSGNAGPGGSGNAPSGNAKESRAWLILPLLLLSLVVLIPLGVVSVNSYRGYRARALLRR